jgi:hypothetical protein
LRARSAGAEDRLGDIERTLESSAYKDPASVRGHGIDRVDPAKIMSIEFYPEFFCNGLRINRRIQTNGQHHHVEFFFFYAFIRSGIPYRHILGYGVFSHYRRVASDESHAGKFLRPLKVPLKILPIGTHIIMEYRTLQICIVIFCDNHLLLCISAAYG